MLQGEHSSSNSTFQILNYSYSIYAKHELQQSLETNQTTEIIPLPSDKRTVMKELKKQAIPLFITT